MLTSPSNGATVSKRRVLLDWNDTLCAANYDLVLTLNKGQGIVVDSQTNLPTSQYTTQILSPGKTYSWQVRACNNTGCSDWTAPWTFKVSGAAATD